MSSITSSIGAIARKPNVSAQATDGASVDRNFCGGKAPRPVPLISQGTRDSIKTQATVFGKTCGELARQFGISRCEVETILLQEMSKFAEYDAAMALVYERGLPSFDATPLDMPLGMIIGTVELVDCVTASKSPWFCGGYGWVLKDPKLLAHPIPARGALGFWDFSLEVRS